MRFEVTAKYAKAHDFDLISSTLGISRWKDMNQINGCGKKWWCQSLRLLKPP
jgi:predicted adenine nucleotide alpha hydrolase (AANH) superfamily ATPase